ncbi:MAG: LPS assembly lipoprotein LptE [Sphingomicrobium sp.]
MRGQIVLAALLLSSCGLQPLYGGGSASPAAITLSSVQVAPIGGQSGWLLRNALIDRLAEAGQGTPAYRLDVTLGDNITSYGLRSDEAATQERRTLRARYQLVDLRNGMVVLDASAGSDASIDIVSSEYATVAAEQTALENLCRTVADQIVARLSLYRSQPSAK